MEETATYQPQAEATDSMEASPGDGYGSGGPAYLSREGDWSAASHLSEDVYAKLQEQWHAIRADYYNITDGDSLPLASLLVLTDREKHAVRAELHVYDEQDEHVYDLAIRRSQQVLGQQYFGDETVPLRILQSFHVHEELDVPVQAHNMPLLAKPTRNLQPLIIGVAGVVLLFALVWGLLRLVSPTTATETAAGTASVGVADIGAADIGAADIGAADLQAGADADGVPLNDNAVSPEQVAFTATDALPASRNAHSGVAIGQRIRILPNFRLTLRSEAGATAGIDMGFMENGQEATVIGGPTQTQGNNDTIVWWYVRLDNGQEAWAAANTSEYMLLEPVAVQ